VDKGENNLWQAIQGTEAANKWRIRLFFPVPGIFMQPEWVKK
jgi:hypothetical protein